MEISNFNSKLGANSDIKKYNQTLTELIKNPNLGNGNFINLLNDFTQKISLATGVTRVSVWQLQKDANNEYLECLNLWDNQSQKHSCGIKLFSSKYPNYFKAVKNDRTLRFDDVYQDNRVIEFTKDYFPSYQISSMLDAPFYFSGEVVGVVCLENTGLKRNWSLNEESFIISATDILSIALESSSRVKLESEIKQFGKYDALCTLSGGIAHDFNNILGIIIGYSELLKNNCHSEKDINFLDEILNAANRGVKITKNLLTFSKNITLSPKVVNINNFINAHKTALDNVISNNSLALSLSSSVYTINIDIDFLLDSLINICKNASQAIESKGKIEIISTNKYFDETHSKLFQIPTGKYLSLQIKDNGKGMSENTIKNIFNPFFSLDDKSKLGLGLSHVLAGVEKSKGFIQVSSKLGVGTTITLLFPKFN